MNRLKLWVDRIRYHMFIWLGCKSYKHFHLATEKIPKGYVVKGVVFSDDKNYVDRVSRGEL